MEFKILYEGKGEIFCKNTPSEMRKWTKNNKERTLKDKRMNIKEAVRKFVKHGDYVAIGGFGHVRIPMVAIFEIVRQKKRDLCVAGHTAVQDIDVLMAGGCVKAVDIAYVVGFELRGLSSVQRRLFESGQVKFCEYTNGALAYRLRAGAQGVPFIPVKVMLGTDTLKYSPGKVIECPFTGEKVLLLPSLNPDVLIMHAHRADKYGNVQIDGTIVKDDLQARASKRVVVTVEEIIEEEIIRKEPGRTIIPFYMVDAVVEQPWGSHPGNMPYKYYFDHDWTEAWLAAGRAEDPTILKAFMEEWIYGLENFDQYLAKLGRDRLEKLKKAEVRK
ncbi:MAG: CoA transferase subunit A [Candidatus Lokiarchaeota archaeon]|nr:CoA transferase subunit A [Candidatus Lokiarchaeota archaeon]